MRQIAAVALALALVALACGDSADETTVVEAPTSTDATASTDPPPTTEPGATPSSVSETAPPDTGAATTVPADAGGGMDCADMWPEDVVQSVLGAEFSLGAQTGDGSACSFEALPATIVLSWRPGGQTEFDAARDGAALTGDLEDVGVCSGGWALDLGGFLILEALADGKILNATSSGVDDALASATALLGSVC